jgi:hypothetical protein
MAITNRDRLYLFAGFGALILGAVALALGTPEDPRVAETFAEIDRIREYNNMPPLER